MTQSRWNSKVLWVSLAAQILSMLVLLNVITPTLSETINTVIGSVLQMLVVVGVLNSPTSADKF
jgi:uncharacterized membrane protein